MMEMIKWPPPEGWTVAVSQVGEATVFTFYDADQQRRGELRSETNSLVQLLWSAIRAGTMRPTQPETNPLADAWTFRVTQDGERTTFHCSSLDQMSEFTLDTAALTLYLAEGINTGRLVPVRPEFDSLRRAVDAAHTEPG